MLSELWREAAKYGRISLMEHDEGIVSATIHFFTLTNVKLEAKSGYKHKAPEEALKAALEKAIEIAESMGRTAPNPSTIEGSRELLRRLT